MRKLASDYGAAGFEVLACTVACGAVGDNLRMVELTA